MEEIRSSLKIMRWLYIIYAFIRIVIDIAFEAYTDILNQVVSTLIVCAAIQFVIAFANNVIELQEDLNSYKKETNEKLSNLQGKLSKIEYSLDKHKEDFMESNITTILPSYYEYENGRRRIRVIGNMTEDKTVGVRCKQCNRLVFASTLRCPRCNTDFYYGGQSNESV